MAKFRNAKKILDDSQGRMMRARVTDANRPNIRRATPPAGWETTADGGYINPNGFRAGPPVDRTPSRAPLGVPPVSGQTAQSTPNALGQVFWKRLMQRLQMNDKRGRETMNSPISRL